MSELSSRLAKLSPAQRRLLQQRMEEKQRDAGLAEPVAIVGMACRFPGAANLDAYWRLISDGIHAISEIPPDRWAADEFYDSQPDATGKTAVRWGGFLDRVDQFDPRFFGITPRWTGELTQILFIHMVFLGIPMAFRKRMHVTIEFFVGLLPANVKSRFDRVIDLVIIGFLTAVTVSTIQMMSGRLGQTLTPGLKLPRLVIYIAIPICTVLLGIEIIRRFLDKDYS